MFSVEIKKAHLENRINKMMANEVLNLRLINKAKRQLRKLAN